MLLASKMYIKFKLVKHFKVLCLLEIAIGFVSFTSVLPVYFKETNCSDSELQKTQTCYVVYMRYAHVYT